MRSSSDSGQQNGPTDCPQTEDQKRDRCHCPNGLYIVGIGPGSTKHLSQRTHDVLTSADIIVGYGTYVDLIRPLVAEKKIIRTGMTKEIDRVAAAIDEALKNQVVAIVCSGDPGVYAMAGLALEMCAARNIAAVPAWARKENCSSEDPSLLVEIVPGIPALCSGASLLGAPLMHDFAAISLSDLMTPWEVIEKRIDAAAKADFVMVIYNPKSKKRNWQLEKTREIVLQYRDKDTPVGVVTSAMRDDQSIVVTTLGDLDKADVNMLSTVFIGNQTTTRYGDFMYTLRGYGEKYGLTANIQ